MDPNFRDAWYHLRWAAHHLRAGARSELRPLITEGRRRLGRGPAPEPSRLDRVRRRVERVEPRVAVGRARDRVRPRTAR